MRSLKNNTTQAIRILLLQGPVSAKEACANLKISQPVFSRLIQKLAPDLLIIGQARATRYALKREIPPLGKQIQIYFINPKGETKVFGQLVPIHPNGFFFQSNFESKLYEDLPYFLNDLRPAGYLGRNIPRQYPELGFPQDITTWSSNTTLQYIGQYGSDLIGNLIIGDIAFKQYTKRFKKLSHHISTNNRTQKYEELANDILKYGDPGSSAGGEQPKFLTTIGLPTKQVMVKFSPPIDESIGRRRGDLLICEHIAHEVLRKAKKNTTRSEIIKGRTRIFLELERFDRRPPKGRLGIISLASLNAEFVGEKNNWILTAKSLFDQKRITKKIYNEIRFLHLFGQLIANTDMHLGNLSFFLDELTIKEVAPVYDMLPMMFAPVNEQILSREFTPPSPSPVDSDIWYPCWEVAKKFWKEVSLHKLISSDFKKIALDNLKAIKNLQTEAEMLPSSQSREH